MTYPGGKNGAGVYQRIISTMPPHRRYFEGFCGSGAVLRNKRPADENFAFDLSPAALDLMLTLAENPGIIQIAHECFIAAMEANPEAFDEDTLIYADPPYVMDTRKSGPLYDHEMSDQDHYRLLNALKATPAMVMLSGYRNNLYDDALKDWHRVDYMAQTRQGMVEECLWMNFPPPTALHDYSHLGSDYRERERIKRKKARWTAKIQGMDHLERLAIMEALTNANNMGKLAVNDLDK